MCMAVSPELEAHMLRFDHISYIMQNYKLK